MTPLRQRSIEEYLAAAPGRAKHPAWLALCFRSSARLLDSCGVWLTKLLHRLTRLRLKSQSDS